jgi:hypothetical protein
MDIQHVNLLDLELQYRHKSSAASDLLRRTARRTDDTLLSWKLRPRGIERISDAEARIRDSFDYLLNLYSMAEIASLIALVPNPLPREFRERALADLSQPAVQKYYEQYFPLLLPTLLRQRISGQQDLRSVDSDAGPVFMDFLQLSRTLENDRDLLCFLWMLDGAETSDGVWLDDLIPVLADERQLVRVLTGRGSRGQPIQIKGRRGKRSGVVGFSKFLEFCNALDALLRQSKPMPLLQSAMWHFHSFWFQRLRKEFDNYIKPTIMNWASWTSQPYDTNDHKESQRAADHTLTLLKRLMGKQYGKALEDAERKISKAGVHRRSVKASKERLP